MADWLDKDTKSHIMSCIRSKNTKPELMLRKALWDNGFSYQPKIAGSPDFVHKKQKLALFVHGCFWHMCPKCFKEPQSNRDYWIPKLKNNVTRDRKNKILLRKNGYKTLEIWGHEIRKNFERTVKKIKRRIE